MPRISIKAIAIAFCAEFAADLVSQTMLLHFFARGMGASDMSTEQMLKLQQVVFDTTDFVPWAMVLGTATTVGGGYLAARIAQRIPYYHGLAMGITGILFILLTWRGDTDWMFWLGLLSTIPAALYGSHLAKRHMPVESV